MSICLSALSFNDSIIKGFRVSGSMVFKVLIYYALTVKKKKGPKTTFLKNNNKVLNQNYFLGLLFVAHNDTGENPWKNNLRLEIKNLFG
jgi:hypothetical protein